MAFLINQSYKSIKAPKLSDKLFELLCRKCLCGQQFFSSLSVVTESNQTRLPRTALDMAGREDLRFERTPANAFA
jgi:hypothetical protein